MCLPIVFQQCDFDFAGNWHAEAVEEYEEEEALKPIRHNCIDVGTSIIKRVCKVYISERMSDCPGVGGRKSDVECGVVRWGPIWSDRVISHTVSMTLTYYNSQTEYERISNTSRASISSCTLSSSSAGKIFLSATIPKTAGLLFSNTPPMFTSTYRLSCLHTTSGN